MESTLEKVAQKWTQAKLRLTELPRQIAQLTDKEAAYRAEAYIGDDPQLTSKANDLRSRRRQLENELAELRDLLPALRSRLLSVAEETGKQVRADILSRRGKLESQVFDGEARLKAVVADAVNVASKLYGSGHVNRNVDRLMTNCLREHKDLPTEGTKTQLDRLEARAGREGDPLFLLSGVLPDAEYDEIQQLVQEEEKRSQDAWAEEAIARTAINR